MIVVFDAQCLLCNSWVQFLLKHDKQGIFQFAAIQGQVGSQLLAEAGLKIEGLQTLLLVDGPQSCSTRTLFCACCMHWAGRGGWLGSPG